MIGALQTPCADILAVVRPLMRDPASAPTLEELRFAIRKRQQEDWRLARIYWDELMEWARENRRGWKTKLAAYRRYTADLASLHAAERRAWGIDPATDIFDGLREQWKKDTIIEHLITTLREASSRTEERAAAQDATGALAPADPVSGQDFSGQPVQAAAPLHAGPPDDPNSERPAEALQDVDPARCFPFGKEVRLKPREAPKSAAALARFTRDNPMIPAPLMLFVGGRFAGAVPVIDPYRAILEFKTSAG